MLGNKAILILQTIYYSKRGKKLKELAEEFDFSERTVRYEIDKIVENLDCNELGLTINKGEIFIEKKEKLFKILQENYKPSSFSIIEREQYITLKIFFERFINQVSLSKELDVSRSTIKLHLKKIEELLLEYHIELKISHKKGLEVVGTEENIRQCTLKIVAQINHSKNEFFKNIILEYLKLDEEGIILFVNYCQKLMNILISDEAYEIIKKYIKISILMLRKNYVIEKNKKEKILEETKEYKIIEKGKTILEAHYDIEIPKIEYLKIVDYFLGSHNYNINYSYLENWVEIEMLINKMIANFNKRIDVDISKDEVLLDGLLNHIKPTIYRIKNKIELENTIYDEVISIYPHLFEITRQILEELENFIGEKFSDDEVAFIVIHFRAAIDRNRVKIQNKKNILVVCGLGYGTSKLLAQQLKDLYSVNIVDILPYYSYKKRKNMKDIDLIVSTVDILENRNNLPVVKVNPILTNEDIQKLNKQDLQKSSKKVLFSEILEIVKNASTNLDENKLLTNLKTLLGNILVDDISQKKVTIFDMLSKTLIKQDIEANSWEEAVKVAGENLLEHGYISQSYIDNMIDSIKKYGSYSVILPEIAFPHSKNDGEVFKTAFSIVKLKKSVIFPGGIPVKIVVAFSSKDNKEHLDAFIEIVEIMGKKDFSFLNFVKKYCKK